MIKISVANTIQSMNVCLSMWPCCFFLNQVVFQNEPCDKGSSAIYVVVDCTLKLPNLDFHRGHLLACGYFGLGQLLFKMPSFFVLMNLIYRSSFLVFLWIYFILIDRECMLLYCLTSNVSQVINQNITICLNGMCFSACKVRCICFKVRCICFNLAFNI